jgi:ATP-binding cassette subfamily F protein uup
MLLEFKGVTLVVTHDRYFLNRVATSILAFEGNGRVTRYAGNFDDYLLQREEVRAQAKAAETKTAEAKTAEARSVPKKSKGLSFAENRELSALLPEIEQLEGRIAALEAELADPKTYAQAGDRVRILNQDLEQARATLGVAMTRWEELETKRTATE